MKFIKVSLIGCFNSFRQHDFHTYHKTLPLPPKTTVAGFIGSALGISPREVNDEWLCKDRFKVGVVGKPDGFVKDLWQIRKMTSSQGKDFEKGNAEKPYYTSVIVREILYKTNFILYLCFNDDNDYTKVYDALVNPKGALSLGREDELVKVCSIDMVELEEKEKLFYSHTILPFDIVAAKYDFDTNMLLETTGNLINHRPIVLRVPTKFEYSKKGEDRRPAELSYYSYVSDLPVAPKSENKGWVDSEGNVNFQLL